MRRTLVVMFLLLTLLMALGGVASAQSDRACVGTSYSTFAHVDRGVGPTVSFIARAFQPFGAINSHFATTCEGV